LLIIAYLVGCDPLHTLTPTLLPSQVRTGEHGCMATIEIWNSNFPTPDTLVGRAVFNVNDELADMEPKSEEEEGIYMYGYIRVAKGISEVVHATHNKEALLTHDTCFNAVNIHAPVGRRSGGDTRKPW